MDTFAFLVEALVAALFAPVFRPGRCRACQIGQGPLHDHSAPIFSHAMLPSNRPCPNLPVLNKLFVQQRGMLTNIFFSKRFAARF